MASSWLEGLLSARAAAAADAPYPYSGLQMFGIFIVFSFPAVAFVFCCLRCYSKAMSKSLGLDDWLMCTATALAIGQSAAQYKLIRTMYAGVHTWQIPPHNPGGGMFWYWVSQTLYYPILTLAKVSILLFLTRLGGTKRVVHLACQGLIWLNLLKGTALLLAWVFQCWPIQAAWQEDQSGAVCVRVGHLAVATCVLSVTTDLLVLVLPFWIFLDLRVNKRVRIALLGVFTVGVFVPIVSVVRLWHIVKFYFTGDRETYSLGCQTAAIEVNLAIITACMPIMWPLARKWFPTLFERMGFCRPYYAADIEVSPVGHSKDSGTTAGGGPGKASKMTKLRARLIWPRKSAAAAGAAARKQRPVVGRGRGNIGLPPREASAGTDMPYDHPHPWRGHTEIRSAARDSNESLVIMYPGIVMRTDVSVYVGADEEIESEEVVDVPGRPPRGKGVVVTSREKRAVSTAEAVGAEKPLPERPARVLKG